MRMTFSILALAAVAGTASADVTLDAHLISSVPADKASAGIAVVDPAAKFSNVTTFGGSAFVNGGTAGGITRLVADDISMTAAIPAVTKITFSMASLNTVAVSARPRLRFYANDGPAGSPGTVITGFSFNPITINPNTVNLFFFNPAAFALPQNFWAGMTFDNVGATATAAQMDFFGQGIYNPVDVGSSADVAFRTTAAGSFLSNLPPGANFNFGGVPVANFGWEFVPAPTSLALLGMGGLVIGRRRR